MYPKCRQVALGPKAKNGTSVVTITVEGGRTAILGTLDIQNNPHFEVRWRAETPEIGADRTIALPFPVHSLGTASNLPVSLSTCRR